MPEGMVEMLATMHWAQKLKRDHRVCVKADRAPKKEDAKTGTVRLAGDADAVATAAKFIAEFGEVAVRKVSVDEEQQGLLIGKGGSTIRQLQETTVRFTHRCALARRRSPPPPPAAHRPLPAARRPDAPPHHTPQGCSFDIKKGASQVVIAGPAAAVAQAEDDIKDLFRTQSRTTLEIRFDPEQKGTLLGKGGSTINEIQKKSGGAID